MPQLFDRDYKVAKVTGKICMVLLLLCLLTRCSKTIDLNLPFEGPQIAVVGHIDPAEGVVAFVSRTAPPTGTHEINEIQLTDATVTVYDEQGNPTIIPHDVEGYYRSSSLVVDQGERYRLETSAEGLDTLRSEWVEIPEAVIQPNLSTILKFDTSRSVRFVEEVALHFEGIDPAGEHFYLAEAYRTDRYGLGMIYEFFADFDTQFCEVERFNRQFFSDKCIQEDSFTFTYIPRVDQFPTFAGEPAPPDQFAFAFRSIDENYYSYQRDRLRLDGQTGVILEPRPSTTNVSGGVGVFLASNSFIELVDVP